MKKKKIPDTINLNREKDYYISLFWGFQSIDSWPWLLLLGLWCGSASEQEYVEQEAPQLMVVVNPEIEQEFQIQQCTNPLPISPSPMFYPSMTPQDGEQLVTHGLLEIEP